MIIVIGKLIKIGSNTKSLFFNLRLEIFLKLFE